MEPNLKFQIKVFKLQIYSSILVTMGGVFFGVGVTLLSTSKLIMATEDYSDILGNFTQSLSSSGLLIGIIGLVSLGLGWILPIISIHFMSKKIENNKNF